MCRGCPERLKDGLLRISGTRSSALLTPITAETDASEKHRYERPIEARACVIAPESPDHCFPCAAYWICMAGAVQQRVSRPNTLASCTSRAPQPCTTGSIHSAAARVRDPLGDVARYGGGNDAADGGPCDSLVRRRFSCG